MSPSVVNRNCFFAHFRIQFPTLLECRVTSCW